MPLKIIVVGGGIAGLCAGIALRQAQHEVTILEKSRFATEIGAAIVITPNGARVLTKLGFSFSRARAVKIDRWDTLDGESLNPLGSVDLSSAKERYGYPLVAVHRVDLHTELLQLAKSETEPGKSIQIHLGARVANASSNGSVTLENGTTYEADLVIAADGLHSVLRNVVLGNGALKPSTSGLSAFRFLIETEILENDTELSAILSRKGPGMTLLADTKETTSERHIIWYTCRDGKTQNLVGIHPTREEDFGADSGPDSMRASMLHEFSHFHSDVSELIARSSHVKCWPLLIHDPLSTWHKDCAVLIGDAAHPMLPFSGQGANQAIEDAGALSYLLGDAEKEDVPDVLRLFEAVRRKRASRVQIISRVRAGREKEVENEARRYAEPPGSEVPTNHLERTIHDYSFDVYARCDELLGTHAHGGEVLDEKTLGLDQAEQIGQYEVSKYLP